MLRLWLGLTDIYNLFHDRDLTLELVAKESKKPAEAEAGYQGILELRALHKQLDEAILAAYGWAGAGGLALGHDFHEVETLPENDRVRYTISPAARKEVLKRLLAENHKRAEAEANAAAAVVKPKRGKKAAQRLDDDSNAQTFPNTPIEWETVAWLLSIVRSAPRRGIEFYITALVAAASPDLCEAILSGNDRQKFKTLAALTTPAVQIVGAKLPMSGAHRWATGSGFLVSSANMADAEPGLPILRAMNDPQMPKISEELVALIVHVAQRASNTSQTASEWSQKFAQRRLLIA